MNGFVKIRRIFRDLLFLHIFNRSSDELKDTANVLFNLSLVLLFLAVMITSALTFILAFVLHKEIEIAFAGLNNYSMYASGLFLLSILASLFVKVGAFEKYKPFLVWISFVFTIVGIIGLIMTLFPLTLGKLEHLLLALQ